MSGSKRRYKTLRATPLAKVVQAEIAASRRAAESAKRTDRLIRQGMTPLEAHATARHGARTQRRKSA
jgi:hypothetical protein